MQICSIEKEEYGKLYDFVKGKKLRTKNAGASNAKETVDDDLVDSDVDDEPDAYLARVKQEGKQRDDDDSDESDESFNPGQESDVAEEFDSNASESESEGGSDDSSSKKKKPKKEKRKEKEKENKKEKKPKKKKEREDGRPKNPMSAYFLWMNEKRSELKEKYPSLSVRELSKKAGELWKDIEKTKYEKEAERLKGEYKKAMEEFNANGGGGEASSSKKDKSSSKKKSSSSSSKKKESSKASPVKSGSFKSKEFISDDSSSDSDKDTPKKKKKKGSEKPSKKSKKEASESEESEGTPASDSD